MSNYLGTLLDVASGLANRTAMAAVNATDDRNSITEFTQYAYVTPPALYERALIKLHPEVTQSISQYLLSVYTARYLLAVNRITHISEVNTIAMMNAAQDPGAFRDIIQSTLKQGATWAVNKGSQAVTSGISNVDVRFTRSMYHKRTNDLTNLDMMHDFDEATIQEIQEVALEADMDLSKPVNIAVGRQIKVDFSQGDKKYELPVVCALFPRVLDPDFYNNLISAFIDHDRGWISRWNQYISGDIKSFTDFALGLDLIQQNRYLTMHDDTGQMNGQNVSAFNAGAVGFLTGQKQMNVASAMLAITDKLARQFEGKLHGKFANPNIRQLFFQHTGSMILCVVNVIEEMVTVYTKGMAQEAIYSFDQLKPITNNASGFDLNSIMKAYNAGQQYNY